MFGRSRKISNYQNQRWVLQDICLITVMNSLRVEHEYIRIGHYVEYNFMECIIQLRLIIKGLEDHNMFTWKENFFASYPEFWNRFPIPFTSQDEAFLWKSNGFCDDQMNNGASESGHMSCTLAKPCLRIALHSKLVDLCFPEAVDV